MLRRLTIERVTEIILFALLLALATRVPTDTDTWWHLRSADYTLSHGMIYADPFSHTMHNQPWINHSWLSQLVLLSAWRIGGDTGLALYTAILATFGMYMVYRMCPGNIYVRAFVVILGAAAAAAFWSPRPQMMSFALSTVLLYILHLLRTKHVDRLWLVPPMMALWGNLHAGFSIGFILLAGTIAGAMLENIFNAGVAAAISWSGVRKLILITLLSAAALLINPYGPQILLVPFQTVGIGALTAYIQEWQSPNFQARQTWPFLVLLLLTFSAASASPRRLGWTTFVLLSGTAFMAFAAARNMAVFAVVATPALAQHADAILRERGWSIAPMRRVSPLMGMINLVLLIVVCTGAVAVMAWTLNPARAAQTQAAALPVQATAYLQAHRPAGKLFNSYNWGGYLLFALPDVPVFVDGRTDLYGDELLDRYLQIVIGDSAWAQLFAQYDVTTVLIETGSPLARTLAGDVAWREVYRDDLATIFEKVAA